MRQTASGVVTTSPEVVTTASAAPRRRITGSIASPATSAMASRRDQNRLRTMTAWSVITTPPVKARMQTNEQGPLRRRGGTAIAPPLAASLELSLRAARTPSKHEAGKDSGRCTDPAGDRAGAVRHAPGRGERACRRRAAGRSRRRCRSSRARLHPRTGARRRRAPGSARRSPPTARRAEARRSWPATVGRRSPAPAAPHEPARAPRRSAWRGGVPPRGHRARRSPPPARARRR